MFPIIPVEVYALLFQRKMGKPCSANSHTLYNAKKQPQKMEMPEGGRSRHQFSAETLETL